MLKFLASPLSCKTFCGSPNRTLPATKKRGKTERGMAGPWQNKIETAWIAFLSSPGSGSRQNQQRVSPPFWFIWLLFYPISELIHFARCVKFNPWFNPWIVLIKLRGTEFNRRINLLRGLGRFNRGLALIGFWTTRARLLSFTPQSFKNLRWLWILPREFF